MNVEINLNDIVRVKLNDYGKEIFYHQFDELNKKSGREVIKPHFPKVDDEGYTKMQLWEFMQIYGSHTGMGFHQYLETLNVVIEEL